MAASVLTDYNCTAAFENNLNGINWECYRAEPDARWNPTIHSTKSDLFTQGWILVQRTCHMIKKSDVSQ